MLLHPSNRPAYVTTLLAGAVKARTSKAVVVCPEALERFCIWIWIYNVLGESRDRAA
jgi:hypothetical protein